MIPILLIFSPLASKNTLQNGSDLIHIQLFNFAAVAIVRCTCAYTIFPGRGCSEAARALAHHNWGKKER